MKLWALLLAIALPQAATNQEANSQTQSPPGQVLLTLYSPHGPGMLEVPGRKSWGGRLWVDHNKVGLITPGQFVTLRLSEGDHSLAGERFGGRESTIQTVFSLSRGERYFMRLVIQSKAVAGVGPTRWIAEPVLCQEAYRDAAALEPVKLKRIEKASLDYVAREPYFPECVKSSDK